MKIALIGIAFIVFAWVLSCWITNFIFSGNPFDKKKAIDNISEVIKKVI